MSALSGLVEAGAMSDMSTDERERFARRLRHSCRNVAYADKHPALCRGVAQSTFEARMAFLTSWKRGTP